MHYNCNQKGNYVIKGCFSFYRLGLMSHFGALAAASSRYAALCGPTDPRTIPWYWGRLQPQLSQDKPSPNGKKITLNNILEFISMFSFKYF